MLRKTLLISVCFILFAMPTTAQNDSEWSVWLHRDGISIRVYSDGSVVPLSLPIPDRFTAGGDPGFSSDGDMVGQCAANGENWHVFIFNAASSSMVTDYVVGGVQSCYVTLNENGNLAAVVLHKGTPQGRISPTWEMFVLDVSTTTPTAMLTSTDQLFPNQTHYGLPQVLEFRDGQLAFFVGLMGDAFELPGFIWYYTEHRLEALPIRGKRGYTYLPTTGETIWAAEEPNFPAIDMTGVVGFPLNVVVAADTEGEQRPIFHHPTALVSNSTFIENGHRVAVGFWDNGDRRWIALDREGNWVQLPDDLPITFDRFIYGTADGFVFLRESEDGHDELIHYRFEGDDLIRSVVWQAETSDETWDVVWVTPLEGEPGLRPLTELEMISFEGTE